MLFACSLIAGSALWFSQSPETGPEAPWRPHPAPFRVDAFYKHHDYIFEALSRPSQRLLEFRVGIDEHDWETGTWSEKESHEAEQELESLGDGLWGLMGEGFTEYGLQVQLGKHYVQISDAQVFYAEGEAKIRLRRLFDGFPRSQIGKLLVARGYQMQIRDYSEEQRLRKLRKSR